MDSDNKKKQNPFWSPVRKMFSHVFRPEKISLSDSAEEMIRSKTHPDSSGEGEDAITGGAVFQKLIEKLQPVLQKIHQMSPVSRIFAAVICLSCVLLFFGNHVYQKIRDGKSQAMAQAQQFQPFKVESDIVERHPVTRRIRSVGVLKAIDTAVLKSEIAGVIDKTLFKDGEHVKEGAPLVKLDDQVLLASLDEAQAEYELRQAEYRRAQELFNQKIGTAQQRDNSYASMHMALAKVKSAQARLAQATIKAPFPGLVGLRELSVGSYVQPGQELITVVNLSSMKVDFKVPEIFLKDLQIGQKATIFIDGFESESVTATIEAIDPKVESSVHSVTLRGAIDDVRGIFRPGLFANVILDLGLEKEVPMVPESSVERSGDDEFVYLVREIQGHKVALKTIVLTGVREKGFVEIVEGLNPGDEIVVSGHVKIRDGFPVETFPASSPADQMNEKNKKEGEKTHSEKVIGSA